MYTAGMQLHIKLGPITCGKKKDFHRTPLHLAALRGRSPSAAQSCPQCSPTGNWAIVLALLDSRSTSVAMEAIDKDGNTVRILLRFAVTCTWALQALALAMLERKQHNNDFIWNTPGVAVRLAD